MYLFQQSHFRYIDVWRCNKLFKECFKPMQIHRVHANLLLHILLKPLDFPQQVLQYNYQLH